MNGARQCIAVRRAWRPSAGNGLANNLHSTVDCFQIRLTEQDRRDAIKLEWQQVALVLDRFLLLVFVVGTTLVSFLILFPKQLSIG
jgi:hypothetical protein